MTPLPRKNAKDIDRTVDRLRQVVRVLEELPKDGKHRFGLQTWSSVWGCGTTACAVGWAGLDPWFRRRGLKVSANNNWIEFRESSNVEAANKFFGLDEDEEEFDFLFVDRAYKRGSRTDVTRRINSFCNQLEKQKASLVKGLSA